jgi:hypothetical protein
MSGYPSTLEDYRSAFKDALLLSATVTTGGEDGDRTFAGEICPLGEGRWLFRRSSTSAEEYLLWQRVSGTSRLISAASCAMDLLVSCAVQAPDGWALWIKGRRI